MAFFVANKGLVLYTIMRYMFLKCKERNEMKRGLKLEIKINIDEILRNIEDAWKWLVDFVKDNSLYVNIAVAALLAILIICLIVSKSKGKERVDEYASEKEEPVKRNKKIRYQDIDWDIKKEDKVQTELEKELETPEQFLPSFLTEIETEDCFEEAIPEIDKFEEELPEINKFEETTIMNEIKMEEPIQIEQINLVKAQPSRKFGPDNKNTSRSGRIFTEEELKTQIRE